LVSLGKLRTTHRLIGKFGREYTDTDHQKGAVNRKRAEVKEIEGPRAADRRESTDLKHIG